MEENALFFYALGTVSGDGRAHDTTGHMANRNLSEAKKAKQDEFYTQMNDIQTEINAYLDYDENTFRGKIVLLPCDDPEWSNFTLFFAQNFERLGLRRAPPSRLPSATEWAILSPIRWKRRRTVCVRAEVRFFWRGAIRNKR